MAYEDVVDVVQVIALVVAIIGGLVLIALGVDFLLAPPPGPIRVDPSMTEPCDLSEWVEVASPWVGYRCLVNNDLGNQMVCNPASVALAVCEKRVAQ